MKTDPNCMSDTKLFAYGQKEPLEVVGTFVAEVVFEVSSVKCVDEFTVVKGAGRPLLRRKTTEELKVLREGPFFTVYLFGFATAKPGSNLYNGLT